MVTTHFLLYYYYLMRYGSDGMKRYHFHVDCCFVREQ